MLYYRTKDTGILRSVNSRLCFSLLISSLTPAASQKFSAMVPGTEYEKSDDIHVLGDVYITSCSS